jgi:DNA-binding MarR family transcriptional regulator
MSPATSTLALSNIRTVVEVFSSINDALPVSHVLAFLTIVMWPGRTVGEYARLLGCPPGPASRRISNLGEFMRDMSPGFGLVETHRDPRDRRSITVKPSAKGVAIVEKIKTAMERRAGVARS